MVESLARPYYRLPAPSDKFPEFRDTTKQPSDVRIGILSILSELNKYPRRRIHRYGDDLQPRRKPSSPDSYISTRHHSQRNPKTPPSVNTEPTFATKFAFLTTGILPIIQNTKHGRVEVTPSGEIKLHLPTISQKYFTISPDSKNITVSDERGIVWRGAAEILPWRWTRVYRYASRFIEVCRSKMSRLCLEVEGIRGRVMLNGNFEAYVAKDATLVRVTSDRKFVKIFKGKDDLRWEGAVKSVPMLWKETVRTAMELYTRCSRLLADEFKSQDVDNTALFVSGLGWCSKNGSKLQLFFEDGVRLQVDSETQDLIYCDANGKREHWSLDHRDLPIYICDRLRRCEAFRDVE